MNKILKSYEYLEDEQTIALRYEDPRDTYIYEDSLGEIGAIFISKEFNQILPSFYPNMDKYLEKEDYLNKEFTNIFGEELIPKNQFIEKYYQALNKDLLEELGFIEENNLIKEENKAKKKILKSSNR